MFLRLICTYVLTAFLLGCAIQLPALKEPKEPKEPEEPPPVPVYPEPTVLQPEIPGPPIRDPFQVFPQKYCQQAVDHEKDQDLRKALFSWKVVHSFIPKDPQASERIETLEKQIGIEAEGHFQKGLDFFRMKSIHEAQREFLLTLAYNPDHVAALDYLKHRLPDPDYILYETREGDSLKRIAQEIYKDAEKDFLIAYFNDLESAAQLEPGKTLKLPVIEPAVVAKPQPREEMRAPTVVLKPEKYQLDQAEMHYEKGVKHFLAQELDEAIEEWKETLQLNPDHPKAKKDLERARRMQKNLKKF